MPSTNTRKTSNDRFAIALISVHSAFPRAIAEPLHYCQDHQEVAGNRWHSIPFGSTLARAPGGAQIPQDRPTARAAPRLPSWTNATPEIRAGSRRRRAIPRAFFPREFSPRRPRAMPGAARSAGSHSLAESESPANTRIFQGTAAASPRTAGQVLMKFGVLRSPRR